MFELLNDVASDLIKHEQEAQHHHKGIGFIGMVQEAAGFSPIGYSDQNDSQGQNLP